MRKAIVAACGLMALLASPVLADPVVNGSFESGTFTGFTDGDPLSQRIPAGSSTLPGWNVTAELAWFETGKRDITVQDGNFALDLLTDFCDSCGPVLGSLNQDIATTIGATYTLQFFEGNAGFQDVTTGITAIVGGTSQDFQVPATTLPSFWQEFTLDFTATSATTNISFVGTAGDAYIGLDSISVICSGETSVACSPTVSTPEPSTIALFGVALLSIFGWGKFRRRANV